MRRFFYFLFSFCFFIGGTLATAAAASVEAVELESVLSDSEISITSVDYDEETFSTYDIFCYDSSSSQLSSFSTSPGNLITVPSGTAYMLIFIYNSSGFNFSGMYNVTLNFKSLANGSFSESGSNIAYGLYASSIATNNYVDGSKIEDVHIGYRSYSGDFYLYAASVPYFALRIYFNEFSSTVSVYAPDIYISSSNDGDLEETNNLITKTNSWLSNILDTIIELPETIINLFISAMKNLFIPSDDYFSTLATDLYTYFEEKLGILFLPFDVLIQLCNALIGGNEEFVITFPAFELTVQGTSYTLWSEYEFDYYDLKDQFPQLFNAANIIFTVLFAGWVLDFARHTYDKAVGAE